MKEPTNNEEVAGALGQEEIKACGKVAEEQVRPVRARVCMCALVRSCVRALVRACARACACCVCFAAAMYQSCHAACVAAAVLCVCAVC